jgi:copper(I)-binding protein
VNRSVLRAGLVLVAAAGIALLGTGCASGQHAQTAEQMSAIDGVNAQAGPIALRDIGIAYPKAGSYQKGDVARLEFVAINASEVPDALVEVRTDAADAVRIATSRAGGESPGLSASLSESASPTTSPSEAASPSGTATATGGAAPATSESRPGIARIVLPANQHVSFRDDGPVVALVGLREELLPSQTVHVTFVFATARSVTVEVPVRTPDTVLPPAPTIDIRPTELG